MHDYKRAVENKHLHMNENNKNYRESTLLRVQIPAKANFAPTCVRNSLLSELSWECITYLLCVKWFVGLFTLEIGLFTLEKNPRFTAFLDSNLHNRLAIVTENELGLAFPP